MSTDKKHWYDGKFYDRFIAPNQDVIFSKIKEIIPEGSSVLDVGCGTGRLPFMLADKCSEVTGIDLSSKNIETASSIQAVSKVENVKFIHGSVSGLPENIRYDYVTMSLVIHEVPPAERIPLLLSIKSITENFILADYSADRSLFYMAVNEVVEFLAGRDHYKGYKDYMNNGGIEYLFKQAGYEGTMLLHGIGYAVDVYQAHPVKNT